MLSFESTCHILDMSSLSDMCLTNSFCQSTVCLFIYLTGPFPEQKILTLMKSNLFFPYIGHCFGVTSRKFFIKPEVLKIFNTDILTP